MDKSAWRRNRAGKGIRQLFEMKEVMEGMRKKLYIFGAHSRAQTLAVYLKYLYPEITVEGFLYDNEEPNPAKIEEVPVIYLEQKPVSDLSLHTDVPVFLGTRGVYHEELTGKLKCLGFQEIHPVTVELDLKLRNAYLKKYFAEVGREFVKIDDLPKVCGSKHSPAGAISSAAVYVVRSAFDKPLRKRYREAPYETAIQAGAALTSKRLPEVCLTDDTGEHISDKNRQFCELTALYWIWKHAPEEILGLSHYRRHFLLPEDWVRRMDANGIDVILPTPLYVAPSLAGNYKNRHDSEDWEHMMQGLKEREAETWEEAVDFFRGNLYSPCNMLIMRRNVLDDLCSWLFPLLFQVAEHRGQREDPYQNRYPGFLSERLITFFIEKNREKYRVVYADKNFLP